MADLAHVELRDRLCFHDHWSVADYALAVTVVIGPNEFILDFARYPFGNLMVTQSHRCDSSPLGIALVDNLINRGKRVWNSRAAN